MNYNTASDKIVLSMWHRTRREFVEWTEKEILKRSSATKKDHDEATANGLIHETYLDRRTPYQRCFQITEAGKARYNQLTQGE